MRLVPGTASATARDRVLPTYARADVTIVRGEGCRVWDDDGRSYLDFGGGIAVTSLGHVHPAVTAAAHDQLDRLWHASNLYWTEPMLRLASLLSDRLGGGRAFFCNSGAEANEAAIKLARKATGRAGIVALEGGFHGRTLGALSVTGQPAKWEGFGPLVPGRGVRAPERRRGPGARGLARWRCRSRAARAGARRGRRDPARARLRASGGRDRARGRRTALRGRGAGRARPDGQLLRLRAARHRARSRHAREGARERAPDRGAPGPRQRPSGLRRRATTARPSAATRSRVPRPAPSWRRSTTRSWQAFAHAEPSSRAVWPASRVWRRCAGEGFSSALRLDRPAALVVDACREHGLLVLSAGPDVLRLTPPLVVTEAEVDEALDVIVGALTTS